MAELTIIEEGGYHPVELEAEMRDTIAKLLLERAAETNKNKRAKLDSRIKAAQFLSDYARTKARRLAVMMWHLSPWQGAAEHRLR